MASMNQVLRLGGTSGVGASGTNRAGARPLNTYPHQYFDLSSQEVPRTIKELFRWAMFLYMSHSEIAPIIKKKCEYVLTDIVYDTEDVKHKELWEHILENILNIKEFELEM
jgi:hypothetical protein